MGDRRLYAQFTLDYADSHKIAPLSDAAFRAHGRMILWSRRMLTDGRIPAAMAFVLANRKPKVLAELASNDSESPSLRREENGDYVLHDFLDHQSSRAHVEARQETNRAKGARAGQAKAKRSATDSVSEPVANLYTETETETTPTADAVGGPRKRATRIPEPFMVSSDMRAWAASEAPNVDVDRVTRTFVDYWRAAAGRTATKQDWVAAWRVWLRREHDQTPNRGTPAGGRESSLNLRDRQRDQMFAELAALEQTGQGVLEA